MTSSAEDQEMLTREEVVLRVRHVAGVRHLLLDLFGRKTEVRRRSFGRVLSEIDDGNPSAGRESRSERAEVVRPMADVVIGVDDEDQIDRLGEIR